MPDRVEQFLDGLGSGTAGEPPAAFLRAVGSRRRRRRLSQAGMLAAAVVTGMGVWAGVSVLRPRQSLPRPEMARVEPPALSLVALSRANRDMDVDALELPRSDRGWEPVSRPLRGGDPAQVEAWLSR